MNYVGPSGSPVTDSGIADLFVLNAFMGPIIHKKAKLFCRIATVLNEKATFKVVFVFTLKITPVSECA